MLPLAGTAPNLGGAATASPDTTQECEEAKCLYCLELCQHLFGPDRGLPWLHCPWHPCPFQVTRTQNDPLTLPNVCAAASPARAFKSLMVNSTAPPGVSIVTAVSCLAG